MATSFANLVDAFFNYNIKILKHINKFLKDKSISLEKQSTIATTSPRKPNPWNSLGETLLPRKTLLPK
jgi:hypothetical protein